MVDYSLANQSGAQFRAELNLILAALIISGRVEVWHILVTGFLSGVVSFLLALLCFLAETFIATRLLNFRIPGAD